MDDTMPHALVIRRHAIFKRQYRRVVDAISDFHNLNTAAQWHLLRAQVVAEAVTGESGRLEILDRRASRRDQVLTSLEQGRRSDLETRARRLR